MKRRHDDHEEEEKTDGEHETPAGGGGGKKRRTETKVKEEGMKGKRATPAVSVSEEPDAATAKRRKSDRPTKIKKRKATDHRAK